MLERLRSHAAQQGAPTEREQAQGDSGSSKSSSPVEGHGNDAEADLNKLSDSELERQKAKMDVLFEENRKRPEDEGFVYDLEVDFTGNTGGQMESGWDNEDDDDDDEF